MQRRVNNTARNIYADSIDENILRSQIRHSLKEIILGKTQDSTVIPFATKDSNITIPLDIFSDARLGVLEALVKYLKEQGFTLKEIGRILKKDNKSLWASNRNACRKMKINFSVSLGAAGLPISIFSSENLSCFESAVLRLKDEHGVSFARLSGFFGRNYQTIWTTYRRAKEKTSASGKKAGQKAREKERNGRKK